MATPEPVTHIKDLVPDPANARRHTPRNLGLLSDSLQEVGAARSIVIDERNVILAGNGTVDAAAVAGITKVQVVEADGDTIIAVRRTNLTDVQKARLGLLDNRTAELAEWDPTALQNLIDDGVSVGNLFTDAELLILLAENGPKTGRTDPDDVPEERATNIQYGDIFDLNSHRLMCGDCSVGHDVERLIAGASVQMVLADPPYNVAYTGGSGNESGRSDAYEDVMPPAVYQQWLTKWLTNAANASDDKSALHFWFAESMMREVVLSMDDSGWERRSQIVWNKLDAHYGALGRQYKVRYEPFWYAHKRRHSPRWHGPSDEPSVWDEKQPSHNDLHPTMKPVALYQRSLMNHTSDRDLVLECFGGSGTTVMAAEQLNRSARVMEVLPKFCQVIIDRWEAFTGQKAVKVGEAVRG